jgi:pimeloyl-ACP methyl ester carboxylesterase
MEGSPLLLLLHGFANSSHYFRYLMPLLANRFHLITPDLPSFGFTKMDGESYRYTFAQLTQITQAFVDALALPRFAMYVSIIDFRAVSQKPTYSGHV